MKKYRIFATIMISIFALSGCGKADDAPLSSGTEISENSVTELENEADYDVAETEGKTDDAAGTFYAPEDMLTKNWTGEFDITQCYITNKVVGRNRYYIDENHVLWGCGRNDSGQLGLNHPEDINDSEKVYTDYQKIAENLFHVAI